MLGLHVNQRDYLYASSPSAGFRVSSTSLAFIAVLRQNQTHTTFVHNSKNANNFCYHNLMPFARIEFYVDLLYRTPVAFDTKTADTRHFHANNT